MMNDENDPIREFQNQLLQISDNAERLRPFVKSCEDAIARAGSKASIAVGRRNPLQPKVEIVLFAKQLNETIPLFRELAKEGIHTDKTNTHRDHNVFDVIALREYNLGPHVQMSVMLITGKTDESSEPRCRLEQVGVKEVPIFEMKCDE